MEQNYQEEMALFKYGVIKPLLEGSLTAEEERCIKAEILERDWKFPDGSTNKIRARTLLSWLAKHRKDGFGGLFYGNRQPSKSKGSCTAISLNLLNTARELREEDPTRSVELVLQIMQEGKGLDVSRISPRTLMRYFKRLGLKRGRRRKGKGQHERYEQRQSNDMWHGDTAHTFLLPDPQNPAQKKKAKLIVLIDDASRVSPHAEFYFDEQLPSVIDTLVKALLSRGKPKRILLDNAKTFRSTTLELMCAELDIELAFCRPRRPQGKGKIERYIRTIKESFCSQAQKAENINTLEELNAAFRGWLELYGSRVHEELAPMTPEERWQKDANRIDRSLTEIQIRRAMMLRGERTIHMSTALVNLENREYQANRDLAGQDVQIRWNPERLDQIELWRDGRYLETALLKERKPHVERDWRDDPEEQPTPKKLASATEYCSALMGDRVSEQIRASSRGKLARLEDFVELLSQQVELGRPFADGELEQIAEAFQRLAPLDRAQTEEKVRQVVEEKGAGKHVRVYLERLEPKAFRR
jgi:transposase InsO family protein